MSRKKIPNVDEYNPVIYPRILWVAKSIEACEGYFTFLANDGSGREVSYDSILKNIEDDGGIMMTCQVIRNADDKLGVLVVFADIDEVNPTVIPHEAVHVADYFCEQLGIYTQDFSSSNEPYAYLVGWAGGCISKTLSDLKADKYDEGRG